MVKRFVGRKMSYGYKTKEKGTTVPTIIFSYQLFFKSFDGCPPSELRRYLQKKKNLAKFLEFSQWATSNRK